MSTKKNTCRNCGKPLQDNFIACPYCGTPTAITCTQCGKQLKEEYKTCPFCGHPVGEPVQKKKKTSRQPHSEPSSSGKETIAHLLTAVGQALLAVGAFLASLTKTIAAGMRQLFKKVFGWFQNFQWEKFHQLLKAIGAWFSATAKKLVEFFKQIDWAPIRAAIGNAWTWIKKITSTAWSFLKETFLRLRDAVAGRLSAKMKSETAKWLAAALIILCLLMLLFLISAPFIFTSRPPHQNGSNTVAADGTSQTFNPTAVPVDPSRQTWTVMLYSDADDQILEKDMVFDLNEAETAGSTDRVNIVAQIDRYSSGYAGDGDWSGARRYHLTYDTDLTTLHSQMVTDLGEVNMGSADSLVDFVAWAADAYPADRYVLILSDHGSGWTGGWYDDDPAMGSYIALNHIDGALNQIVSQTDISQFELIGMDACLMGMLEVYNMLQPYAHYAVASQETEPAMGWAYGDFLSQLIQGPAMDGIQLAQAIVTSYIDQDLLIHDDAARSELLNQLQLPSEVTAQDLVQGYLQRSTLSAVNLQQLPALNQTLNQLLTALKSTDQGLVAQARSYAQPFMNIFDDGQPAPFIDLHSFINILAQSEGSAIPQDQLAAFNQAYQDTVVIEKHGENLPGATGIAIHFPISQHFWDGGAYANQYYPQTAERFTQVSLWDDFLNYHYTGKDFGAAVLPEDAKTAAPGFAVISITDPVITPNVITADEPNINIQAQVEADHIAYMYYVVLYQYEDRFLFYDFDTIPAPKNHKVNGVIYPNWKEKNGIINIDINTQIMATAVTDGETAAFAVIEPEFYGSKPESTIYSVKGFYIYSGTGQKVSARMYFHGDKKGQMRDIVGYFGSNESGIAPAEIIPTAGDQFQFIDWWWEFDENGNVVDVLRDGNTLTFGSQPFTHGVTPEFVYPGTYAVGIMVEDMDGNQTYSFAPLTIE